ncbi:hypothetical protein MXB_3547 [Myxobolus squamalis]|nr:hypothetical protein MXB_3547 [Myxobolus squamalis]
MDYFDYSAHKAKENQILNANNNLHKSESQSTLAEIALHQIDVLNNILKTKLQSPHENSTLNECHRGSVYENYINNLSVLSNDRISSATLPPSLRLDANTKINLYKCIVGFYNEKKSLEESGYCLPIDICSFCKNNNEPEFIYKSHRLKSQGYITCPVLRLYKCPMCNATGDFAHTVKYCPEYFKCRDNII